MINVFLHLCAAKGALKQVKILCPRSNRYLHRTDEYEYKKGVVLRRGQEFILKVEFDRKISPEKDKIALQFRHIHGMYQYKICNRKAC